MYHRLLDQISHQSCQKPPEQSHRLTEGTPTVLLKRIRLETFWVLGPRWLLIGLTPRSALKRTRLLNCMQWHGNQYSEDPQYHWGGLPEGPASSSTSPVAPCSLYLLVLGSCASSVRLPDVYLKKRGVTCRTEGELKTDQD